MQFKLSLTLLSILDQKAHVLIASSTHRGICEEDKVKTKGHLAKLPGPTCLQPLRVGGGGERRGEGTKFGGGGWMAVMGAVLPSSVK